MFPQPGAKAGAAEFDVGLQVFAFYHANLHPRGSRFVHVCTRSRESPLLGLSSGWLRGQTLQKADSSGRILVRFAGPFQDPLLGPAETLDISVPHELVRTADSIGFADERSSARAATSTTSLLPRQRPLLSILLIRCWDYRAMSTWSDFAVANDGMLRDLLDGECGIFPSLAGEFELYTAFVRTSTDLKILSEDWAQAVLAGQNQVVWYFLWPCQNADADVSSGCVRERDFFHLQQRMERVGLRSGWPHPHMLYEQLAGKLWVPQMSLNRDYRIPPTVRVHHADVRRNSHSAAAQAIDDLVHLRDHVWSGSSTRDVSSFRGVAKLGFSWQGDDVVPFEGAKNLADVLCRLLEGRGNEQLSCLVQELVPNTVCEHRVLCFHDAAVGRWAFCRERLWMTMKSPGSHHKHQDVLAVTDFRLTSATVLSRDQAAEQLFEGSREMVELVEQEADILVDRWLAWFRTETTEPPAVTRLDFLVSWRPGERPTVWTCEVCECGASLCSVECDARNCAALNWAVAEDPSGRFPLAMPRIRRCSEGLQCRKQRMEIVRHAVHAGPPEPDTFRLLGLLQAKEFGPLLPASSSCRTRFQEPVHALRRAEADPKSGALEEMEMREALRDLQSLVAEAQEVGVRMAGLRHRRALASLLRCIALSLDEGPDKYFIAGLPRKGGERAEKLYLPAGVAVPVLQIGKVIDQEELKLHDWVCQHLRVWLKPEILQTIEARYGTWFVYWPHFEKPPFDKFQASMTTDSMHVDANIAPKTEDTDECPTSRQCVSPNVLKACPMPNTNQNDDSDPELLNDSGEGVVALNASPTGWKRFVRPLANCIACGDVETEMSGLKRNIRSKSKSLEACRHKLRERDSHAMLVEDQLEKMMQELSSVKEELAMERRRTSSMSSMLLSDSVSQQKLQEQVKLAEEQLKDAQQEIGRLSSSLQNEKSERQHLVQALQMKSSEAEVCSERLESTRGELKRCADELQDLRRSLEDSNQTSTRLRGELQEHGQQNANLKERLQQRELELEECESQVHEVSSELSQTSRKLTQTESERDVIERRLAETKAQLDQYEDRLTSLSASLEAAQRETAARSKRMEMTSMAAEDFKGHLHISKARVRHLEEQARATTALLETKHLEQQRLVEQAAAAEEQVAACQGKLASLTSCLDQEQSQSAALRQELRNRDQQIEDLVTRASSRNAEVECLTDAKGSLTKALKAQEDQVECLTEEKGSLVRSLKAQEEKNEELKSQISAMNQQVSSYERRVTELCETLSETQLENAQMALGLERRAMEAEEFLGRIREERRQVADFEQSLRSIRESLHRSLTDKDDLIVELERTCLEREDLTQQLVRAQQKLVQLEEEIGNCFLKAAEDSKQVRESSAQEICQWQITAEMAYRQTTEIALQLDNWRSQYSSLLKALQEKQAAIEKLNGELDDAKKRLAQVAIVDDAEMATLKEQLTQANARLNAMSAAVDLKDTEMQLVSRELMRKGMQAEDYLGQVNNMKDRLVQSEIDLSRYSSELTVARMEKDSLATSLERSGEHAKALTGEMQSMKTQLQKCEQETSILDRCLEDRQLQNDLLSRQLSTKDSRIEDLSCELTALRIQRQDSEREATQSLEVMRSTLQEQLHQNELLSAELTRKRMDYQATSAESRSLRDELTAALDAKSDANCQLEGLKELAKQLQEELRCSQRKHVTMVEELDSMTNSNAHLEAKASKLAQVCKQQANEKEALSNELRSTVGSVQHLQSQLAKYRQHLKENQSKIDSLTRSLKREVQKKDEAATRCAELLCSHPSMCIEAWIGRVRTFRDTDSWQLVAGSGFDERVILKGGETSRQVPAISGETPCIIINAARGRKDRKDDDKVPVRVYNAKKPGAVAVQKAAPHLEVQISQITVFDRMRRLFSKNKLVYDQNFGIVRPYPDCASTSCSSEASFD
ncbi:ebh [Symbiodinium microadriaticum]|nr:ebh [Symbiodinium microadriaticum]